MPRWPHGLLSPLPLENTPGHPLALPFSRLFSDICFVLFLVQKMGMCWIPKYAQMYPNGDPQMRFRDEKYTVGLSDNVGVHTARRPMS